MNPLIDTLNAFMTDITYNDGSEGSSVPDQMTYYIHLIQNNPNIKTVLEIGFNLGISAATFLAARPDIQVVSLDIGSHAYVLNAKINIDKHFPGRHTLIIGDSTTTLPFLEKIFGARPVDLIMIDGGHTRPIPKLDLENSLHWCGPETLILFDDVCEAHGSNGVNEAVKEAIDTKKVIFLDHKMSGDRGWALLKAAPKN
jgi:predicted O-methyltransferase YrrM